MGNGQLRFWMLLGGLCLIASLVHAEDAKAAAAERVRVVLPSDADEQIKNSASVFKRQVEQRCSAKVGTDGDAPLRVVLSIDPAMGKDGFRIQDGKERGTIEVIGQNERGVLYGLGKLLRTSRYSKDGFTPGAWRGESVPQKPIRGIYFATHFHNF